MKNHRIEKPVSRYLSDSVLWEDILHIPDKKKLVNKAVFLDRDGTINIEQGYLLNPSNVEIYPTVADAMQILNNLNILVIVITNQAAMDKKLLSLEQFERINYQLFEDLSNTGARYDALYYCPHSPEVTPNCYCRKPKPGLILQAAKDFWFNRSCRDSRQIWGNKRDKIRAKRTISWQKHKSQYRLIFQMFGSCKQL